MVTEHSQLTVLTGPDAGRVINLDFLPVTLGRGASCGVRLAENYISREHVRLELTADGVVCEVLSASGIRIAGRSFKRGKRVLLDTGDVCQIGLETELLFVAAGDDRDAALVEADAARLAALEAKTAKQRQKEQAEQAKLEAKQAKSESEERDEDVVAAEVVEDPAKSMSPAEAEAARRRTRMRKIMFGLGIYLGLMLIVVVALVMVTGEDEDGGDRRPKTLTNSRIKELFEVKLKDRTLDMKKADELLDLAREAYGRRNFDDAALYWCVTFYKQSLAYANSAAFESTQDADRYDDALLQLTTRVTEEYDRARLNSGQERWRDARDQFERVLEQVPDQGDLVAKNVQRHLGYIKKRRDAEKAGNRRESPI